MCQSLGPKKHDEISEIDRRGAPGAFASPADRAAAGGPAGVYTYLYIYTHVCTCIYIYIYIYAYIYIYIYTFVYVYSYVCMICHYCLSYHNTSHYMTCDVYVLLSSSLSILMSLL